MAGENQKITVRPNGPYIVRGGIPLVRKTQVMSEHGEPLTWKKEAVLSTEDTYRLCRCGQSKTKPFCDSTHTLVGFDGFETADPGPIADRETVFTGQRIVVRDDHSLCVHSGFCGNRITNIWKMLEDQDDSLIRGQIMAMVEKCPSGTLSFALEADGEIVEPDLPKEIAVIPDGPLWISGGITGGATRRSATRDSQQDDAVPLWGLFQQTLLRRYPQGYRLHGRAGSDPATRRDLRGMSGV